LTEVIAPPCDESTIREEGEGVLNACDHFDSRCGECRNGALSLLIATPTRNGSIAPKCDGVVCTAVDIEK
jgi:hypothetical protein